MNKLLVMSEIVFVELICVKKDGKLRVRILSEGYYNDANCQFPKDLRVENRRFRVPVANVNLITMKGKYYYSVKKKNSIQIVDDEVDFSELKIYEDNQNNECAVCLCNAKDTVFFPCGHFYCCGECSNNLRNCPICRAQISNKINKSMIN